MDGLGARSGCPSANDSRSSHAPTDPPGCGPIRVGSGFDESAPTLAARTRRSRLRVYAIAGDMATRRRSSVTIPNVGDADEPRLLRLRANAALANRFRAATAGDAGRLVVVSREPVTLGEPVAVEVSFGALADEVELRGRVDTVEAGPDGARKVGIRLHHEHRERAAYVREVLAGDRRASARSHRRVPTDLAANWHAGGRRVASRISDLSRGGAFVVSRRVPSIGDGVAVEISLPGRPTLEVEGTVSWTRAEGREPGFGVSFKLRDRALAAAVGRIVRDQERLAQPR